METVKTTNKEKTAITVEINADTTQLKKELAEIETTIDRIAVKVQNLKVQNMKALESELFIERGDNA